MSVLISIIYLNHSICHRGWVFNYYPETSDAEANIFQDLYVNTTVADDLAKQKASVSAAAELSFG